MPVSVQLISIIIAAHNRPDLLAKTLACVGQLSYPNLEVVIVDDGSTISIQPVIDQWRATSERAGLVLRATRQVNSGPAAARNTGVEISQGKRILFMDDDDFMAPNAISHLADALDDTPEAGLAMGSYCLWHEERVDDQAGELIMPPAMGIHARLHAMISGKWFVPIHGYLFDRQALERIGLWDCSLSSQEDDELLLRAALAGLSFARAPDAVVYYRQHSGVRRATPGNLSESVRQGRIKRLHADLAIRDQAYRRLSQAGHLQPYQGAFSSWKVRLKKRYGDEFISERPLLQRSAVLRWSTRQPNTLDAVIR